MLDQGVRFIPLRGYVVVQGPRDSQVTETGIHLPDGVRVEDHEAGKVIAVGQGQIVDGKGQIPQCKVGDRVLWHPERGITIKLKGGNMVILLHEREIIAKIEGVD